MNDIVPGLIVAAVTAVAVAAIFYWTGRAKSRKIEALRSLCVQRGWKYTADSGSLHHGHAIAGDGWTFAAISRSGGCETGPGSSDWGHSSLWTAAGEDPGRGTFVLGPRLGGMADFSRLPPQLLSRFLGAEVAGLRPIEPGERLSSRYFLFAPASARSCDLITGRAEELLLAWPQKLPLVVRSSPARLSLQVMNRRLEKPEDVARFIELGENLLAGG